MIVCFFHRGDLDGHCSGAVVRYRFPDCKLIGIDYEDEFPWHEVDAETEVIMVDFSLPMDQMQCLRETVKSFHWIDHHKTAIDQAAEAGVHLFGVREVGKAGCELAWKYFFAGKPMPNAVRLLGRYDVWDETQSNWQSEILPFQFGMRGHITDPSNLDSKKLWDFLLLTLPDGEMLLSPDTPKTNIISVLGHRILFYQTIENAKLMARHAFYTRLNGIAALVVNNGPGGSKKFEDSGCHNDFPLLISFARLPQQKWLVNLYTFRDDVDCGEIARKYGGGGHRKAAGFIWNEDKLPFEI